MKTRNQLKNPTGATTGNSDWRNLDGALDDFRDAMQRDMSVHVDPVGDGQVHRVDDPNGRKGNRSIWYILYLDGIPSGCYGNWRTQFKAGWRSGKSFNRQERREVNAVLREAIARRQAETARRQLECKRNAARIWKDAPLASEGHPYLQLKKVPVLGLRSASGLLLVPLSNATGELVNLQRIDRGGRKRFLPGGQVSGAFSVVGAGAIPQIGKIYIAEGWATAATVHLHTGHPVIAAMSCGNLKSVAISMRQAAPKLELIFAADDDRKTLGNPGITKATEAARIVGGRLITPESCGETCECVDFNDVENCRREGI